MAELFYGQKRAPGAVKSRPAELGLECTAPEVVLRVRDHGRGLDGAHREAVLAARRAVTATGKVLRAAVKQTRQ